MSMAALSFDYIDKKTHHNFHLPLSLFKKPESLEEYLKLEKNLDKLIDVVKGNEKHPLALAMQIIGENLERYDDENHPMIGENVSHVDMVKHLIETNHLHQKDLADIFGSQANVSKFLNGERALGKTAIAGLKKQFGISADFFL